MTTLQSLTPFLAVGRRTSDELALWRMKGMNAMPSVTDADVAVTTTSSAETAAPSDLLEVDALAHGHGAVVGKSEVSGGAGGVVGHCEK